MSCGWEVAFTSPFEACPHIKERKNSRNKRPVGKRESEKDVKWENGRGEGIGGEMRRHGWRTWQLRSSNSLIVNRCKEWTVIRNVCYLCSWLKLLPYATMEKAAEADISRIFHASVRWPPGRGSGAVTVTNSIKNVTKNNPQCNIISVKVNSLV